MAFQVIVFQLRSEEVVVTYKDRMADSIYSELGGHTVLNTVPIVFLDKAELLPPGFMAGIPQGPREFFANATNLRYLCNNWTRV